MGSVWSWFQEREETPSINPLQSKLSDTLAWWPIEMILIIYDYSRPFHRLGVITSEDNRWGGCIEDSITKEKRLSPLFTFPFYGLVWDPASRSIFLSHQNQVIQYNERWHCLGSRSLPQRYIHLQKRWIWFQNKLHGVVLDYEDPPLFTHIVIEWIDGEGYGHSRETIQSTHPIPHFFQILPWPDQKRLVLVMVTYADDLFVVIPGMTARRIQLPTWTKCIRKAYIDGNMLTLRCIWVDVVLEIDITKSILAYAIRPAANNPTLDEGLFI